MGFGVVIASGENNELLPDEITECLTEARVEQFLDQPARFALRFQEDLEDGEPRIAGTDQLQCEQMITIAIENDGELVCLVRGQITEVKGSYALGGPGSYYEVQGIDRRIEMNRVCQQRCWEGRSSEAVEQILGDYDFETEVEETTIVYEAETNTLNQRATDHDFVKAEARKNNFCFWVTYEAETDFTGSALDVTETAHVASSPPRAEGGLTAGLPSLSLAPGNDAVLRVNVVNEQCQTVTAFDFSENAERPTSFNGTTQDDRSGEVQPVTGEDTQPPVVSGGTSLRNTATLERNVCVVTAGNSQEVQNRANAVLTDAGWSLQATAKSTTHLLGGILQPHEVVEVEGLGSRASGSWQVTAVTHVINAADHHQEISLRRNSVGTTP